MKVQELIELLLQFDKGLEVIIEGKDWLEHIEYLELMRSSDTGNEFVLLYTKEDSSL